MFSQLFPKAYRDYVLLFAILFISLLIRLWLLDKRWINPDEGAHLMDAALALDGMIPKVDFGSRQPLYTYALAGFLKLFGTDYIAGRLLPVTCSMLTGIVVFLIARMLFDVKVALLSSVVYWMLPLELLQSTIVKTEPLAMLLTSLSLYATIRFSQHNEGSWLIIAGVFASMGFYVRQSALIIPLTVFGFVFIIHRGQVREIAKSLGLFLAGYMGMFLLVFAFYSRFMSPVDFLTRGLSPFGFLIWVGNRVLPLLGLLPASTNVVTAQAFDVPLSLYYRYLYQAVFLHLFLMIGLGFSIVSLGYHFLTRNGQKLREHIISYSIPYLWFFSLFIAYVIFFFTWAFHIDYSREFLPPLVIILSAWICHNVPALEREGVMERLILGGLCLSAILFFFMQSEYRDLFGIAQQVSLAIALITLFNFTGAFESTTRKFIFVATMLLVVALIVVARLTPLKPYLYGTIPSLGIIGMFYGITGIAWAFLGQKAWPSLGSYAKFLGLSIVLGSFLVSVSYSADKLNLAYNSAWSPQSVENVAKFLKAHTRDGDEVMSGAVIWELQASRRPFQMISHPLGFIYGMSEEKKATITLAARTRPPKVIILDGYTEKTYMRRVPSLKELLKERYQLMTTEGPAKYPVRIYLETEPVVSTDNP